MSGQIIPVLSRRAFDLSGTAAGTPTEVLIVKAIDVSQYTEGEVYVRVFTNSSIGGNATVDVIARITSPTAEEAHTDFVFGTAVCTVTINNSSPPRLLRGSLSTPFGAMLQISVKATQDGVSPQTIRPIISVELVMKN